VAHAAARAGVSGRRFDALRLKVFNDPKTRGCLDILIAVTHFPTDEAAIT
jgi:hypothetical protein